MGSRKELRKAVQSQTRMQAAQYREQTGDIPRRLTDQVIQRSDARGNGEKMTGLLILATWIFLAVEKLRNWREHKVFTVFCMAVLFFIVSTIASGGRI